MTATSDDPWVMYYVVRKDAPLAREHAMALAGAAAVLCADTLRPTARWAPAFGAWARRPRKVALRATAEEVARLRAEADCVCLEEILVALPPCRRSDRSPLVGDLRPYTDGPRPKDPPPEPEQPAMLYLTRPGVLRTTGKAMAQAGHAALMCADRLGPRLPQAFHAWREAGRPGRVEDAGEDLWERARPLGVVVADAGLTQVAPGTETVLALPPGIRPG